MIPQSTIDRIIDSADIVEVVSDYVTLRRAGTSYKGLCPFHDDKTPSFSVSPARGVCKCFSCGKGGNAVHFVMEMEQISYHDALRHLAKKYGIQIEEETFTDEQRQAMSERESMFAVNEWAAKYFNQTMMNNQDGRAIGLAYFRSRGFRDDIIAKFRLGFCLDSPNAMSNEAKAKGYNTKYLVSTGLCVQRDDKSIYDRYRGRAIFPWFTVSGKIVAFGGRKLDAATKGVTQKYVNSPDSVIFHKAQELYGIYHAKRAISKEDHVYMVEGYTDVLAMHQCGIENVVANSGTALNEAQVALLRRFTQNITLIYDGDEAGIHAATRSTDMLLAEGMNVKILLLPDGDDPDSFSRKHNAQEFKEYVNSHQTDFILFKTNLMLSSSKGDPVKRANLTESIIKSIAVIPDELRRAAFIHECAERLNMDEAMLLRSTNANRSEILNQMRLEAQRERERQENRLRRQEEGKQQATAGQPTPAAGQSTPTAADTSQNDTTDSAASPSAAPAADNVQAAANEEYPWEAVTPPPFPPEQQFIPKAALTPNENLSEKQLIGIEQLIITIIVRYGEQLIEGENAEGEPISMTLIEYVASDLEYDGLEFRSPLYRRMLTIAMENVHNEGFTACRFFINNQDEEISREAADISEDRYKLSSMNQLLTPPEQLTGQEISHLLLDYKNSIIDEELKLCKSQLTLPEVKNDIDKMTEILKRCMELKEIQKMLVKRLGDRVVKR